MLSTCLPLSFSLPWFPFWFLCKLIGPPSSWGHPVSNPSLSASPAPRGSPRPDCVYSSALPALSCCVFPILASGSHCSFSAGGLCIIYTITTGKWKQAWVWEKASSGECDGIPKERHFQLNQSRLTKPWRFLLYTVLGRQYSAHVSENSKYLHEGNDVGDNCNYLSRAQFTRLLPQMQH